MLRLISVVRDGIRYLDLENTKFDASRAEMKIAVAAQNGEVVFDTETTGSDFYAEYASQKFGVPKENVTPAMRRVAKNEVFGRLYGGS